MGWALACDGLQPGLLRYNKCFMHRLVLHNDTIRDASEPILTAGQTGFMTGWGVFSTIRVRDGVLFAFERHVARMRRDAELMRVPFPGDAVWLEQRLLALVRANKAPHATLRVNIIRNNGGVFHHPVGREFDVIAFTADLVNWGQSVRLGVIEQARHARNIFAGTKVTSWGFNLRWYEQAHDDGFDEVLLLDENGFVSECTSANIFASFGNHVVTPPLTAGCLPGITRELLLSEVTDPAWRVTEGALTLGDLEKADGVFITSTTRDLLPVATIENLSVRGNNRACEELRRRFEEYLANYVSSRQQALTLR